MEVIWEIMEEKFFILQRKQSENTLNPLSPISTLIFPYRPHNPLIHPPPSSLPQSLPFYFKSLIQNSKMGAVCDNASVQNFPTLENPTTTKVSLYQDCKWPEDHYFLAKIQELKSKGYADFLRDKTLKRHKVNEEYYIGQWDVAGYQKGQGIFYRPGDFLYEGSFDSVPHGNGVLYDLKNGFTYDGQFNHGKLQGQGKLTKNDNLYNYEGAINSDSQPTTGKLTVNHPQDHSKSYTVILSNYPAMKARIEYQDGREYEGYLNLKTFLPEGEGTSKYPNDCIYEGEWLNGQFHGKGKFTWPNGSQYHGDYQEGKKHGHGRFTYTSRKVYDGGWVNGKQEGYGSLFDQSGELVKKGTWRDGVFEG